MEASPKNDLPKSTEEIFGDSGTQEINEDHGEPPLVDAASAFNRELEQLQSATRQIPVEKQDEQESSSRRALKQLAVNAGVTDINLTGQRHISASPSKSPAKSTLCVHGKRNNGYLCLKCPGKGICEHKKQKYSCKICKEKFNKRKKSSLNQFGDLSPINRPMNPMQAAAGIVNALNFFHTSDAQYNSPYLPTEIGTDIGVTEVMSAMVRAIEHCQLKAQGAHFGLAGAFSIPQAQVQYRTSQKYARGRGEGRIEIIETGPDGKTKKRKYKYVCKHGKNKYFCKACGGSMICEHQKQRHYCSTCRANNRHSTKLIKKQKEQKKTKAQSIDDMLPLPSAAVQETPAAMKAPDSPQLPSLQLAI